MERCYRLAERYARLRRGSLIAQELVAEVIEDMWTGAVRCDVSPQLEPADAFKSLDRRICRVVQRRAVRVLERKGGLLGGPGRSAPPTFALDRTPEEVLAIELPTRLEQAHAGIDCSALVSRVRELARGDAHLEELLTFYDRGFVTRRAVLKRTQTGMTKWTYRTARDRLVALAVAAAHEATQWSQDEMASEGLTSAELVARLVLGSASRRPQRSKAI